MSPTIGFGVEKFCRNKIKFTLFDMSGQENYRNLWQFYFEEAEGLVWVIDSTDKLRLLVVKDEVRKLLRIQFKRAV